MMTHAAIILALAAGTLANLAPVVINKPETKATDPGHRLDGSVVPSAYILSVQPYFDTDDDRAFSFDGVVTIALKATRENVQQIVLHSQDLNISSSNIAILSSEGSYLPLSQSNPIEFDTNYSFLKLNLDSYLSTALSYNVTISYIGQIRNDMAGFYRSSYKTEGNDTRWLGITQLESTSARKTFPSFDEPGYKATFQLTIIAPSLFTAVLSNTKVESQNELANGLVRTSFQPTPPMSTYLLAFLISDFEAGSHELGDGREVGIWSKPQVKGLTGFAFDSAKAILSALEEFLGIDYYSMDPNLNYDHIAVPDFNAGAMENWGLITYREAYLIYDPAESNLKYRQQVVTIIAHETAHMWFGDLVTCHWWSNTWLNEGFANYFQYFIGHKVQPTMGLEEQFVLNSVHGALSSDQIEGSESLTNPEVNSPVEISGHFGTITYSKGGSIIRMVENLIGTEALRQGLNQYLNENKFGLGTPESLFAHLENAASVTDYPQNYEFSVTDVFSNWTLQSGFPLITVSADFESGNITLSQERFYITPETKSDEVYLVPISYITGNEPKEQQTTKPKFIMSDKEVTFNKGHSEHEWVVVNVNQSGFYRVNYDDHLWGMLIETLDSDSFEDIPVLSRAQIVDDVFALARSDVIDYEAALNVLDFLHRERSNFVWVPAVSGFNFLRERLDIYPEDLASLDKYILNLISGLLNDLGLKEADGEDYLTTKNRILILELACELGHADCEEYAHGLLDTFSADGTPVPPNQRTIAYRVGLQYGDGNEFAFLWEKFETSLIESDKMVILGNLGRTTNEQSIHEFLDQIFKNDSIIRKQDQGSALSSACQLKTNAKHIFEYVKEKANREQISRTYNLSSVLSNIAASYISDADIEEIETWSKDPENELSQGEIDAIKSAIDSSKKKWEWTNAHLDQLKSSLKLRNSASAIMSSITLAITTLSVALYFC